jgi:hypothetical protein
MPVVDEVVPLLHWIMDLGKRGLTTMMVVDDFLRRQLTLLWQRSHLTWSYMGEHDVIRIYRGT